MSNWILVILAALSATLFTISICSYVGDSKKRKKYKECIGTIDRIWRRRSSSNHDIISPIIFYTVCGKTYKLIGTHYSKDMEVGQRVAVLYDPDDPSKAIMTKGLYGMSFGTGIVGAAFTVGFIVIAVLKHAGLLLF